MAPLIDDDVVLIDVADLSSTSHDSCQLDNDAITVSNYCYHYHHHHSATCLAPVHLEEAAPTHERRCVSFGVMDTIYDVLHLHDYTAEEIKASWFDRVDLRQMKDAVKIEARLLDRGVLMEGGDVTIRGLEGRTRCGVQIKRANKLKAYSAVFMELEAQYELGFLDEEAIADEYYEYSQHCRLEAQMIAGQDAKYAQEYFQS